MDGEYCAVSEADCPSLVAEESAAGNGAGDTNDDDVEEETEEDDVLAADVVLDADTEHSDDWDHGRDHGGFNSDGNGVNDGGDKQLVSVHGAITPKKVTTHSAGHWLLS